MSLEDQRGTVQRGTVQCVILAGGLGTRLEPLTLRLPKHLAPVNGEPFADLQLRGLKHQGVDEVVYCIGKFGHMIRDYVGDGSRWGLRVRWVDEGEALRGTAGALRLALDQGVLAERFLVVYGDSFLRFDLASMADLHRRSRLPATMAILKNEGRWDTSNVRYVDGESLLYDKRAAARGESGFDFIDYGAALLERSLIADEIPAGRSDLADLYHRLSVEGRLAGFETRLRFYEIGSPAALRELEERLADDPDFVSEPG